MSKVNFRGGSNLNRLKTLNAEVASQITHVVKVQVTSQVCGVSQIELCHDTEGWSHKVQVTSQICGVSQIELCHDTEGWSHKVQVTVKSVESHKLSWVMTLKNEVTSQVIRSKSQSSLWSLTNWIDTEGWKLDFNWVKSLKVEVTSKVLKSLETWCQSSRQWRLKS